MHLVSGKNAYVQPASLTRIIKQIDNNWGYKMIDLSSFNNRNSRVRTSEETVVTRTIACHSDDKINQWNTRFNESIIMIESQPRTLRKCEKIRIPYMNLWKFTGRVHMSTDYRNVWCNYKRITEAVRLQKTAKITRMLFIRIPRKTKMVIGKTPSHDLAIYDDLWRIRKSPTKNGRPPQQRM